MSGQMTTELSTVTAWLDAANSGDAERLVALSSPDIAIIGPRGRSVGHQALRTWLASAGLTLTALQHIQREDTVVVEQHAVWRSAATLGADSSALLATRFQVRAGKVLEIERYESLDAALTATGLSDADAKSVEKSPG